MLRSPIFRVIGAVAIVLAILAFLFRWTFDRSVGFAPPNTAPSSQAAPR